MSEPRLVTPLLADHIMGEPISDHYGIRCCPALEKESEEKYIVKIVAIPASQRQLDALLLSGAYSTAEEAREYFRALAEETVEEARTLQKLTKLEGFWGCEGWQLEPTEDGTGFEVYLLSRYGTTLERHLRRNCLTHLAAVNLGLDLCAALSVCRRNGWMYVDLKPENIIMSDTKGFLIGDLGFLGLKSMKYASLPDKYRSAYTAPEIQDAYSTLNTTLDIYAAGRILGMVFNGGALPEDPAAVPAYADPEMTQIIHRACAENPEDRWQDPEEMGQALVSYMQSHAVNDTPIVPQPEPEVEETEEIADISEKAVEEETVVSENTEPEVEPSAEEITEIEIEIPVEEEAPEAEAPLPAEEEVPQEESLPEEPEVFDELEQFVIEGFLLDDDLQDADAVAELSDDVISDEVNEMLAQADDLIAHKAPEPVVAPEPVEIPMPEPILPEPEPAAEEEVHQEEPEPEEAEAPEEETAPEEEEPEWEEEPNPAAYANRRKLWSMIGTLVLILVLLLAGIGGKYYYDHIYLQNISAITVDGAEDWMVVTLDTQIDNSLLSITCTDLYGNSLTQPVVNNQATFQQLPSGIAFRIQVVIAGRHQLTGITTATYTSVAQTTILNFNATIGKTDGSVNLNFSVQGPDSASGWLVKFSADGVAERTEACSSHGAMITGLEVGKTYTFRLVPVDELYVVGGDTTEFTATAVILPQNLTIQGFENNLLLADWSAPEGITVESWTVRCYNSAGYDASFTVTEPKIEIGDLDISQSYTLDVKAEGMLEGKQVTVSANSVTFKGFLVEQTGDSVTLFWNYEGTAPEAGWTLRYSVDGGQAMTVSCEKNTVTLENPIPDSTYAFEVLLPEGVDHFGDGTTSCLIRNAAAFAGYGTSASLMQVSMCIRPQEEEWSFEDVAPEAYTNAFTVGDQVGFVIGLGENVQSSPDEIQVMYILRSGDGTFLRMDTVNTTWDVLCAEAYCTLELPWLPETAGSYTVEILFNRCHITPEHLEFFVDAVAEQQPEIPEAE